MKLHETSAGAMWQKQARKRFLPYLLLACVMTLIARSLHTSHWRWADLLDTLALDQCFETRGPVAVETITRELPQTKDFYLIEVPYNLPRPVLAQLIERLRLAKAVALDFMLVDQRAELSATEMPFYAGVQAQWQREQSQLTTAMKRANNVVVGMWPESRRVQAAGAPGKTQLQRIWQKPAPEIWQAARYRSHLWVQPSPQDGITRHAQPFAITQTSPKAKPERTPGFSLAIAAAALGIAPQELSELPIENNVLPLENRRVSMTDDELMVIDYLGPRSSFDNNDMRIRYNVVLELYEPEDFAGKIIFVGGTDFKSKDEFTTPFGDMPGVHVHMHAAATLLSAQGPPRVLSLWQTTLIAFAASLLLVLSLLRFSLLGSLIAAALLCVALFLGCAWLFVARHSFFPVSVPLMAVVLTYNGIALYRYAHARATLARFVGNDIAGALLNPLQTLSLSGHTEVATAFFCDLRQFSTASERLTPEATEPLINAYTNKVTETTQRFGGRTIDYFGDGVFVLFRVAQAGPDHAYKAVQAALTLQTELRPLVQNLCEQSGVELQSAIGIHTGPMHVGVIGSQEHMKMGALGDAVNVAARVQGFTTRCGHPIIVTRECYDLFRERLTLTPCGYHEVRGRTRSVELFGAGEPFECSDSINHTTILKLEPVRPPASELGVSTP